jgi:hypothetical protein
LGDEAHDPSRPPANRKEDTMSDTYTVIAKFTTSESSDEHLDDAKAIKAEVTSWLESLKASVECVSADKEEQ